MLQDLYKLKCLDYRKLVLKYYTRMNLEPTDAVVIISILNTFLDENKLNEEAVKEDSLLDEKTVSNVLAKLLQLNYLEVVINMDGGKAEQAYLITPLFLKLEQLITVPEQKKEKESSQLMEVIKYLEGKLARPLSSSEMKNLVDWISDDHIGFDKIMDSTEHLLKKSNSFTMSQLERSIYAKNKVKASSVKDDSAQKFYEMMDK